jgi:predicted transcriptional regulator
MPEHALLLSIRPQYASMIFDGTKTVELRRTRPRLKTGDLVLVYVSSPVKALLGAFEVDRVVVASVSQLWNKVKSKAGITAEAFRDYFSGADIGYGIVLKRKWKLGRPVKLESLRERSANFRPPQGYHYLTIGYAARIGAGTLVRGCRRNGHRRSTLLCR